MRGIAVPTTVWSNELKNMANMTPTRVKMTCRCGSERKLIGLDVLFDSIIYQLFTILLIYPLVMQRHALGP